MIQRLESPRDRASFTPSPRGLDVADVQRELSPDVFVRLHNVSFAYPAGVQALRDVSLEIPCGQVTAIVGPSGCGKTSLLRIVSGLLTCNAGSLTINFAQNGKHPIAMVSQVDTLLPWLKVKDNVGLFYKYHRRRAPKSDVYERVNRLLKLVDLSDFADAYPKQLSGGMRRRVGFLTAVAAEPQLLLLDEPFASVDEPTRVQIHEQVFRIVNDLGITTVLVTHDLAEAVTLSHQVIILSARPAHVAMKVEVPFEAPRSMIELRATPEFLELYGELWTHLGKEIQNPTTTSPRRP